LSKYERALESKSARLTSINAKPNTSARRHHSFNLTLLAHHTPVTTRKPRSTPFTTFKMAGGHEGTHLPR
jgi:hypothetical protein